MIITLQEQDRAKILEYVGREPEMNLFFIGDIENFGVSSETVSIYANVEDGEWDCLLLRFHDFYILYSQREDYRTEPVVEFLKGRMVECISGKTELIQKLIPYFPDKTLSSTYMTRCDVDPVDMQAAKCGKIRRLTADDVDNIMDMMEQIEEFAASYDGKREKRCEEMKMEIEAGCIAVGVFEGDKLVCQARTSADNSMSAMVVGVATLEAYRGKGYATAAVKTLCREAFKSGRKFLCLFYNNPVAGRIYNRIGFKEIGEYAMFR